jgi:PAS domain S-box-containing protein
VRFVIVVGNDNVNNDLRKVKAMMQSARVYLPDTEALSLLVEHSPDTILVIDPLGIIRFASPSAEALVDTELSSIIGTPFGAWLEPGDRAVGEAAFSRILSGESLKHIQVRVTPTTGGLPRHCEISGVPLVRDGAVSGAAGILRDITDIRLQQEAAAAEKDALNAKLMDALNDLGRAQSALIQKERQRAFSEVAGGIVHDFNNILTLIIGHAGLLMETSHPVDIVAHNASAKAIHKAAMNGQHIVRRLRGWYEPGAVNETAAVDVNAAIAELDELTSVRRQGRRAGQEGRIELRPDLHPVPLIVANRVELCEALLNVLLNAYDELPGGGTVSISTRHVDDQVVVEIADNGPGMSAELRDRCLEPFFTTKGRDGTGLGLSETAAIMKRYGGEIDIESEPGKGTSFLFRFPVVSEDEAASQAADRVERGAGLSVMIVGDDIDSLNILDTYLRLDDHHVQWIIPEALDYAEKDCSADILVHLVAPEGESTSKSVENIAIETACYMRPWGKSECPCYTAEISLPLTLQQVRDAVAKCRKTLMECQNCARHKTSSTRPVASSQSTTKTSKHQAWPKSTVPPALESGSVYPC